MIRQNFYFFLRKPYKTPSSLPKNMADDKIRLPSGQGGLTRYFDEYKSKIEFSPGMVIVMAILIMVIVVLLHYFGAAWLS